MRVRTAAPFNRCSSTSTCAHRARTGEWNTGWRHGVGFTQWTGSHPQRDAFDRVCALSEAVHEARALAREAGGERIPGLAEELEAGLWHLLRAEMSCSVSRGEGWIARAHADLDEAERHPGRARQPLH